MTSYAIDANVLVTANDRGRPAPERTTPQAGLACIEACVRRLLQIKQEGRIALDDSGLVLEEYQRQALSFSGQPGMGDEFFRWAHENQANPERCVRVAIHPLPPTFSRSDEIDDFEEFPKSPAFSGFDRSDRKYVAIVIAARPLDVRVLNAVDSDWWLNREALAEERVQVAFLCPEQFEVSAKEGSAASPRGRKRAPRR